MFFFSKNSKTGTFGTYELSKAQIDFLCDSEKPSPWTMQIKEENSVTWLQFFINFHKFSEFQKEKITTNVPQDAPRINGIPCGRNHYCSLPLNEVCVGGVQCTCRPDEGRATSQDRCEVVDRIPLSIRVLNKDSETLLYSSEYGSSDSAPYVEITHQFVNDIGRALGSTTYGPRYVTTDVNYITHPKTVNRSFFYTFI